jgi:hypothetical protein
LLGRECLYKTTNIRCITTLKNQPSKSTFMLGSLFIRDSLASSVPRLWSGRIAARWGCSASNPVNAKGYSSGIRQTTTEKSLPSSAEFKNKCSYNFSLLVSLCTDSTMALGSTQPVGKNSRCVGLTLSTLKCWLPRNSETLNIL